MVPSETFTSCPHLADLSLLGEDALQDSARQTCARSAAGVGLVPSPGGSASTRWWIGPGTEWLEQRIEREGDGRRIETFSLPASDGRDGGRGFKEFLR